MMNETYALVILCGGRSSRMGCNKAFLPFGDKGLLEYQVERFSAVFPKIYASIPNAEASHYHMYESIEGCQVISDLEADLGPIGGIYSCFRQSQEDILFFISVDTPFVSPEHAKQIIDMLISQREADRKAGNKLHNICASAYLGNKKETLFAAYHRDCIPSIETRIKEERYSLYGIFKLEEVLYAEELFYPINHFYNMNDKPAYYRALQFLFEGQKGDHQANQIPMITFCAKSGTGKTTYLEKLLPLLKEKGIRLAVVKHDAHKFEIDKPGKDSYRLAEAGADHMIITSQDKTAAIFKHPGQGPSLYELLEKVENVDLIITEGYKQEKNKKIELLRKGYNEEFRSNQEQLLAVVADFPFETELPLFDLNKPEDMVDFLLAYMSEQNKEKGE